MKYQKVVFSFVLFLALFWNTFYVSLTYAYYIVDQPGFIEQFCEKIDKPEMKCNGKCHLKDVVEKKITTEDVPLNMIVLEEPTLFFKNIKNLDLNSDSIERKQQPDWYFNFYTYTGNYSLDRPPQV